MTDEELAAIRKRAERLWTSVYENPPDLLTAQRRQQHLADIDVLRAEIDRLNERLDEMTTEELGLPEPKMPWHIRRGRYLCFEHKGVEIKPGTLIPYCQSPDCEFAEPSLRRDPALRVTD